MHNVDFTYPREKMIELLLRKLEDYLKSYMNNKEFYIVLTKIKENLKYIDQELKILNTKKTALENVKNRAQRLQFHIELAKEREEFSELCDIFVDCLHLLSEIFKILERQPLEEVLPAELIHYIGGFLEDAKDLDAFSRTCHFARDSLFENLQKKKMLIKKVYAYGNTIFLQLLNGEILVMGSGIDLGVDMPRNPTHFTKIPGLHQISKIVVSHTYPAFVTKEGKLYMVTECKGWFYNHSKLKHLQQFKDVTSIIPIIVPESEKPDETEISFKPRWCVNTKKGPKFYSRVPFNDDFKCWLEKNDFLDIKQFLFANDTFFYLSSNGKFFSYLTLAAPSNQVVVEDISKVIGLARTLLIKSDGQVLQKNKNLSGTAEFIMRKDLTGLIDLAETKDFIYYLMQDGTVKLQELKSAKESPAIRIEDLEGIKSIGKNNVSVYFLKNTGEVYTIEAKNGCEVSPFLIKEIEPIKQICVGNRYTLLLSNQDTLYIKGQFRGQFYQNFEVLYKHLPELASVNRIDPQSPKTRLV